MYYIFRDYNPNGVLEEYYRAKEPAFLVGLDSEIRLMYGEFDELTPHISKYSILERIAVIRLPKDQEKIDALFQSTGLTEMYIKAWKEMNSI